MARRDRIEAVTVLEEIAARLPRDLREVFWNDPRRRELRAKVEDALAHATTRHALGAFASETPTRSVISSIISTPLEQRLARLLEINRDLLGELDLGKLTAKIVCYAVELLQAERGFVILRDDKGGLAVHSSSTRPGDIEHQQFSRSIAERVMDTREPIVSVQARNDSRMQGYTSVHQMLLESVASVPIMGRYGEPIGALYVETRRTPGKGFEREIPTLRAFADQVALAIETARLVAENRQRADELSEVNEKLVKAQERLRESLGDRTEQLKRTRQKLRHAQDTLYGHFGYQGVVGSSGAMRRCYALIDRVKDTDVPVLITGESGTGKEVVARAIHRASTRNKAPFLGVNCGAIPENLLESELFGHVRGAFTGADRDRKGLLRDATGGTVLLDEIGEMPQKMQAGLLRVLQERTVRPVGGSREEPVDCRFLFATHRNLREMVDAGKFREDLFYRIHVVELPLPGLRERVDDLPLLVDHFLGIFAARYKRERGGLTKDALRRLVRYSWPGNVRQLEHVLLSAWIMNEEGEIDAPDLELPDEARAASQLPREPSEYPKAPSLPSNERPPASKGTLSDHRRSEKERIIEALEASNWNRVKAAELSGIPRRTFYRRLREYNIQ
jgi:serine/threonine-protein kinase PknK